MAVSRCVLLLLLLWVGLMRQCYGADDGHVNKEVMRTWSKTLPGTVMPRAMKKLVSHLSAAQIDRFKEEIEGGVLASEPGAAAAFCASAHLLCLDSAPPPSVVVQVARIIHKGVAVVSREEVSMGRALATWFLENELREGSHFPATPFSDALSQQAVRRSFLPRELAELLGRLTPQGLRNILSQLHISQGSVLGNAMQATVQLCMSDADTDTDSDSRAACITSLEDLADYLARELLRSRGSGSIQALGSTTFSASNKVAGGGRFKVVKAEAIKGVANYRSCHSLIFPFHITICHTVPQTKLYSVTLESTAVEGLQITNVVHCHMDTSNWNPQHVAFQVLGKKPGDSGICHWSSHHDFAFVLAAP